jgi:hypothetical protein
MGRGGPSIAQTYIRTPWVSNTQFHVLIAMRAGLQRDGSRASSVWTTFRKARISGCEYSVVFLTVCRTELIGSGFSRQRVRLSFSAGLVSFHSLALRD